MTQAETQPRQIPEIQRGIPFKPFTQQELEEAFGQILPASNANEVDRLMSRNDSEEDEVLIEKKFSYNGETTFYAALLFSGPYAAITDTTDRYVPFPENTQYLMDMKLMDQREARATMEEFPVEVFLWVSSEQRNHKKIRYNLNIQGLEEPIQGKDIDNEWGNGFQKGGQKVSLVLPGDPALLSTMEITIE